MKKTAEQRYEDINKKTGEVIDDTKRIAMQDAQQQAKASAQRYDEQTERAAVNRRLVTASQPQAATATAALGDTVTQQGNLNDIATAKQDAQTDYKALAVQLGLTADSELAQMYAQNIERRIAAEQQQEQFDYEMRTAEEDEDYNNALSMLSEFGKVMTKKQAEILGVPVGTSVAKYYSSGGKGNGPGNDEIEQIAMMVGADLNEIRSEAINANGGLADSNFSNKVGPSVLTAMRSYLNEFYPQLTDTQINSLFDYMGYV
ncbi:MAG: hypothetical protein IJV67_02615 [Clostridia bacterium]|nr:hypothetical protein [Clostridia bacterium]